MQQVELLRGSMMSEDERESLNSDLESARLNIAETERMLEVATSRNAGLEEEIRTMRGETEGYTAKVLLHVGYGALHAFFHSLCEYVRAAAHFEIFYGWYHRNYIALQRRTTAPVRLL